MRIIVYDTEIQRAIPNGQRDPLVQYCAGWTDFVGMGISVIAAVDVASGIPRVFFEDNLREFAEFSRGAVLAGHTNNQFDDQLIKANGLWTAGGSYDILRKLRKACGEPEDYRKGLTKGGRTVNDCARVNLNGLQKSEDGAQAPLMWQRGEKARCVDYCLRDVMIEYQLFLRRGSFVDPATGNVVALDEPVLA